MRRPRASRIRRDRAAAGVTASILILLTVAAAVTVNRMVNFLGSVTGNPNPFSLVPKQLDPPPGSVPWKLSHGQQVHLLLLGYGGSENESPYLTDTLMVATLDPASRRIVLASIPRDLWVRFDAWPAGHPNANFEEKVNDAFAVGTDAAGGNGGPGKLPEFSGRDGGGHLTEHVLNRVTGVQFDKYAAVDFKAFRDVVNALGGVDVCLSTPLDDNEYPDYHFGYVPGGIHFAQGCQHVDGERALQLARSRKAEQPEQATDFGRAKRQQMVLGGMEKKAVSVNGVTRAPQLMSALQKNFKTDLDLVDMKAIYDWASTIPDSQFVHVALTNEDFLDENTCGPVYTLCPEDPTYRTVHSYFASLLVEPRALGEHAPVQLANANFRAYDLADRVTKTLAPLGLQVQPPVQRYAVPKTVIYDYSGGRYPATAAWLSSYFSAPVEGATAET